MLYWAVVLTAYYWMNTCLPCILTGRTVAISHRGNFQIVKFSDRESRARSLKRQIEKWFRLISKFAQVLINWIRRICSRLFRSLSSLKRLKESSFICTNLKSGLNLLARGRKRITSIKRQKNEPELFFQSSSKGVSYRYYPFVNFEQ